MQGARCARLRHRSLRRWPRRGRRAGRSRYAANAGRRAANAVRAGRCGRSRAIRPSSSTRTRSASTTASSTSWVTSSTAGRCRCAQLAQQVVHLDPGQRVERAERLVGQQQLGARQTSERASAARCASPPDSSRGQARSRPARPDLGQRGPAPLAGVGAARARAVTLSSTRSQGSSRESWKTTDTCSGTSIAPLPGCVVVEPGERPQQGALARAAAPEQGDELSGVDVQVEPASTVPLAEAAAQPAVPRTAAGRRRSAAQCPPP